MPKTENDIMFIGSLVEFISRKTKNRQAVVADIIGYDRLKHIYDYADVNHCLSMEDLYSELCEDITFPIGKYDMSKSYNERSIKNIYLAAKPIAFMTTDMKLNHAEAFNKYWEIIHAEWFTKYLFNWDIELYRQPSYFLVYCYENHVVNIDDFPCI